MNVAVLLPLVCVLVLSAFLTYLGRLQSNSLISLPIIVSIAFAFFFVGRPIYILASGETSIGSSADIMALNDSLLLGAVKGAWLCAMFMCAVVIGFIYFPKSGQIATSARPLSKQTNSTALAWIVVALLLLNVASLVLVISSVGSIADYIDSLAVRSRTLRGLSFLTLTYLPLAMATAALFVALQHSTLPPHASSMTVLRLKYALVAIGAIAALLSAAASGGRSAVLLTGLLPLVIVYERMRDLSVRSIVALGAVGLVLFVGLSVGLRDRQFEGENSSGIVASTTANLIDLPRTLWGQQDARPFDSVLFLASEYGSGAPVLNGSSYLTSWTYFVPRLLWADKPFDGGNAVFTRQFNSRFYSGDDRIETSVSAIGEAWLNARWLGVVVAGLLFGIFIGAMETVRRSIDALGPLGVVLYAFSAPVAVSFLRGDAFHNAPLLVMIALIWGVLSLFSTVATPVRTKRSRAIERDLKIA